MKRLNHLRPLLKKWKSSVESRRTLEKWLYTLQMGFPIASTIKNPPPMQETQVWSLGGEDPLEEAMATYSNILAWRILWTEEPAGLQPQDHKELDTIKATEHVPTHPSDNFFELFGLLLGKNITTDLLAYYSNPYHFLLRLTHTAFWSILLVFNYVLSWVCPLEQDFVSWERGPSLLLTQYWNF